MHEMSLAGKTPSYQEPHIRRDEENKWIAPFYAPAGSRYERNADDENKDYHP